MTIGGCSNIANQLFQQLWSFVDSCRDQGTKDNDGGEGFFYQSKSNSLAKLTLKTLSNNWKVLPKGWNFTKSGNSDCSIHVQVNTRMFMFFYCLDFKEFFWNTIFVELIKSKGFSKMDNPRSLFHLFHVFSKSSGMWIMILPVSVAKIQTHNLLIVSLLP